MENLMSKSCLSPASVDFSKENGPMEASSTLRTHKFERMSSGRSSISNATPQTPGSGTPTQLRASFNSHKSLNKTAAPVTPNKPTGKSEKEITFWLILY